MSWWWWGRWFVAAANAWDEGFLLDDDVHREGDSFATGDRDDF